MILVENEFKHKIKCKLCKQWFKPYSKILSIGLYDEHCCKLCNEFMLEGVL